MSNEDLQRLPSRRYRFVVAIAFCMVTLYSWPVNRLTKQEQLVLCIVLGLLLTGWAVKTYRTAHPTSSVAATAKE